MSVRGLGPGRGLFPIFLAVLVASLPGCSSSAAPASPPKAALWGDMKPIVSVKELMHDMIDPLSDNVFNAVSSVETAKGLVDTVPTTDEEWDKVRTGAIGMAEGISLLKVPRPFTPPGEENDISGAHPVELSAAQITAKVEKDPIEWNARIEALRNVALEVLEIVKKRDAKELWNAGEDLDTACESCHRSYWYPGEDAEFYRGLHRKMQDFQEKSRGVSK